MAWQIISANRTTQLVLSTTDSATVMAGIGLSNTSGSAIDSTGSNQQVHVFGMVASSFFAIDLGTLGASSIKNSVYIGSAGVVSGGTEAIRLRGAQHKVENHGTITSGGDGIFLNGTADGETIKNFGTIYGVDTGMSHSATGSGTITTVNYGTIAGDRASYEASFSVNSDVITNHGTMAGDVFLDGGNDSFANLGTGVVEGRVYGGAGTDLFVLGGGEDTIYGGADLDFIDFSRSSGVRFSLDPAAVNTGLAAGDYIREVEGVYGSMHGADIITGDSQANYLIGLGGTDTLYGGTNGDTITGGVGKDVLFGGLGDDVFLFSTLSEGGDKINDFSNKVGNNDRFEISADELAFAGILGPRALLATEFYVGKTNICKGVEDRIILRTTDNTVWFDSNGKAAGGLTMLADLQAGVTLTFADFVFV